MPSLLFGQRKNKAKLYIGLELNRQFVRLIMLKESLHGYVPIVHDEVALAHDMSDGTVVWSELREALSILKERHAIHGAHVVIPQADAFIVQSEVTDVYDVPGVIYKNIPYAPQELEYDVVINNGVATIIAIHKQLFAQYLSLLAEFNISPLSVQTENQTIVRTATPRGAEKETLVCVHVSPHKTVVTIATQGLPYHSQTLLHDSIESFDENNKQARLWRRAVSRILFSVYEKEGTRQQYSRKIVYMSGEVARTKIDQACLFLKTAIGNAEIETMPVWQHCFDIEEYIPSIFYEDALRYSVVLGGALTETKQR